MKCMTALLGGVLLLSAPASGDFFLSPISTPEPHYPQHASFLQRGGSVLVEYNIRADGSLADIEVLRSTHPAFTREVVDALSRWQYQPWPVDGDHPVALHIRQPFVFDDLVAGTAATDSRHTLAKRCGDLLEEYEVFQEEEPEQPLEQLPSFQRMREWLNRDFAEGRVSHEAHGRQSAHFEAALPGVLAACKGEPKRRFIEFLPTGSSSMQPGSNAAHPISLPGLADKEVQHCNAPPIVLGQPGAEGRSSNEE
jgi:TonB family protein